MNAQRRVVHIIPKFSSGHWGGAEQGILGLSPHLSDLGYSVEVWTNNVFDDDAEQMIGDTLVRRFPARFLSKKEADLVGKGKSAVSRRLLRTLISERPRPDLVHLHTHNRTTSAVILLCRALKIPTVLTLHSRFRPLRPRVRFWFPNEAGIRWADAVVTVSSAVEETVRSAGLRVKLFDRIPNGVDPAPFQSGDGAAFRQVFDLGTRPMILCVGRLYETKNQVALVKALEEVPDDPSLVLIGSPTDADYVAELEDVVRSSPISDRVHILKTIGPDHPALYNAYAAADAVVLPSLFEAFPLVALEAWAAGAPLVASAVGGLNDLVTDGANGLLIERPDEPAAIADAVSRVLMDASLASALRAGGTDSVQHYRWGEIAKTLGGVYEREIRKRHGSESLRSSA